MKKTTALGIFLVLLLSLSGCGGTSGDSIMKDQIKIMNEMADSFEKNGKTGIEGFEKRMKDNENQLENLKLSAEEKKKLVDKYKGEMVKAAERMAIAAIKAGMKDGMKKGQ